MVIKFCDDGEYDGVERRTKSQRCHPPLLELRGQTKHHCALVIHCYDRPNRARARENIVKYCTLYMEGRIKVMMKFCDDGEYDGVVSETPSSLVS